MPRFILQCIDCDTDRTVIRSKAEETMSIRCQACGGIMGRLVEPTTTRIVEILDNGLMSRRIERPADAERLYKEAAVADNKNKGF